MLLAPVPPAASPSLTSAFRRIVARRRAIVLAYALLVPPAALLALRVPRDHSLERMIVASDPDAVATRAFQRTFPEKPSVLLIAEADEPLSAALISRVRALEEALGRVKGVSPVTALAIAERLRPGITGPGREGELRELLAGTSFFRKQALLGDGFLGVALLLDAASGEGRDRALAGVETAIEASGLAASGSPARRLRRVGEAFVESYLERETAEASARYFPLFGLFVVALNLFLFRSGRALAAVLATLGVCVLLGTAAAGLLGYASSIVSSLVPLTLMVTGTASLVYLHSRFVDREPEVPVDEHQVFALANKFLPVTASLFAAAVGFAALAVSRIRPIREMGIWAAVGLLLTWIVCFTLFPALQKLLRTPTRQERALAGAWVLRAAEVIPRWSYRWRWPLLLGALLLSLAGTAAIFGFPGRLRPMPLETDSLDYIERGSALYQDTREFEATVSGLTSFSLWITGPPGAVVDARFLAGLDRFAVALEGDRRIGSVTGLTSVLRLRRYAAGLGDALPPDAREMERVAADLEPLLLSEEGLRSFVDPATLGDTRLAVLTRAGANAGIAELAPEVERLWAEAGAVEPLLARARIRIVGQALLAEKISTHLVPTLVESFALTAAIIFATFFVVFRSGAARLMAMIPSLFAILVMFLVMRLAGIPMNVATILIATTVLGASENDQVHFFYHFQEKRREAGTEESLAHAIRVAGSAIFFATLVNAGGFLALALSDLPPMRQFGVLVSTAFLLSMLAAFTALPAALWVLLRERPDGA